MNQAKEKIVNLFQHAGVTIDGKNPSDIHVHNERFYNALIKGGSLAFGETYMAGWWDCEKLDGLAFKIFAKDLASKITLTPGNILLYAQSILSNLGSKERAFEVGKRHYDLGNDLFERMLDKRMIYTCGYWKNAKNIDQAQEAKLDLVCKKLDLKEGQKILDIGCGWGGFAQFAAERYKVSVVGVTVSKEQAALGMERCKGLPVEFRLQDYREIGGSFDHIVSLGMFEHVGQKNYRDYFTVIGKHLKDEGLFLLHTIGTNTSMRYTEPWVEKYIFPNGMIPSIAYISKAFEGLFVMEDWHNFGADYDKTLMAWHTNFTKHWPEINSIYTDTFFRMWNFYLLFCAGSFRARTNQLWQVVLSKKGIAGGYSSVR